MIRSIILVVLIFSLFTGVRGQPNINTRQVISYYENGKIAVIENIVTDSCYIFSDVYGDYIVTDTCHYGYFKEYYSDGILKTLGQYDCVLQKTKEKQEDCFKSGIWYSYNIFGEITKITGYELGLISFVRFPHKQNILIIEEDSVLIKMQRYDEVNSYFIKRYKGNDYIALEFPVMSDHNYWLVSNEQINIFNTEKEAKESFIFVFKYDDTP